MPRPGSAVAGSVSGSARASVSPRLKRVVATSRLTRVAVAGLAPCQWTSHAMVAGIPQRMYPRRKATVIFNSVLGVTSHHFWSIPFVGNESFGPAHASDVGVTQRPEAGVLGALS